MRKAFLAVLSAAILIGMLALPATALTQGVGVITGAVAQVGSAIDTCTKDVQSKPTGTGIFAPGVGGSPALGAGGNNKYRIQIPRKAGLPGDPAVPETFNAVVLRQGDPTPRPATGQLSVCGSVTAVGGQSPFTKVGPYCGMSKGFNGKGKLRLTEVVGGRTHHANLTDVGWKFSLVTVLPVLGKVREQDGTTKNDKGVKTDKYGTLVGLLSARSLPGDPGIPQGTGCTVPNVGGQFFRVDGVAAVIAPSTDGDTTAKEKEDVILWNDLPGDADRNDNPIFCKGTNSDGGKCPIYQTKPKPAKPKDT